MGKRYKVYLHTGSNIGEKEANLQKAATFIAEEIGEIKHISSLYETEAWGNTKQPNFLNQAIEVHTNLSPEDLLKQVHAIEQKLGRIRGQKWTARTIDIDILFYADQQINSTKLTIPHPHLHNRNFVLIPMMEIAPYFQHPTLEKTIEELYADCEDLLEVILVTKN